MTKWIAILATMLMLVGAGTVFAQDCVEVDFDAPDTVYTGGTATASGELTNCGSEAAWIEIAVTINYTGGGEIPLVPEVNAYVYLAAGETVSKSVEVPIPMMLPAGTYEICITATSGEAEDSVCQVIEVVDGFLKIHVGGLIKGVLKQVVK